MSTRRHLDQQHENEAATMRRQMDWLLRQADMAEDVNQSVDHPIWLKVLKPILEETIDGFRAQCLTEGLTGAQFEKQQAVALYAQGVVQFISGLEGDDKAAELRKQAEKVLRTLEEAEKKGLIRKRQPEDGAHVETG